MSLQDKLGEQLNRWEAAGASAAPYTFDMEEDNYRLHCEFNAMGTLGCALGHMTASGGKLASASIDELKSVSETLAARLTYLLEPVAPIEIDQDGCVIQMRSDPPHREQEDWIYYELLVHPGRVTLRRFRKEKHQPREAVSAFLTREVLVRLAKDLVAVLN